MQHRAAHLAQHLRIDLSLQSSGRSCPLLRNEATTRRNAWTGYRIIVFRVASPDTKSSAKNPP